MRRTKKRGGSPTSSPELINMAMITWATLSADLPWVEQVKCASSYHFERPFSSWRRTFNGSEPASSGRTSGASPCASLFERCEFSGDTLTTLAFDECIQIKERFVQFLSQDTTDCTLPTTGEAN